ncbi:hypothetical protein [Tissierella praeacuta]
MGLDPWSVEGLKYAGIVEDKGFHNAIVIRITSIAHALNNTMFFNFN